jgi:hypothetical protein
MQPIVHFLLFIVAGFGVGIHIMNTKKKILLILILALSATAIDIDHLLPIYQETGIAIFHNVFVFILLPAELFLLFFIMERKKTTSIGQRSSLIMTVMFIGAMLTDGISESGMPLFYPLRSEMFAFINFETNLDPAVFALTSGQVIMILWGTIIVGANLLENLIYNDVEGRKLTFESKPKRQKESRKSWLPVVISGMPVINLLIMNTRKNRSSANHKKEKA